MRYMGLATQFFISIGVGHKGAEVSKHLTSIALHLVDGAWIHRSGQPVGPKGKQAFSLCGRFFLLALSNPYSTGSVHAVAFSLPASPGMG